jgi:hypothetical protein
MRIWIGKPVTGTEAVALRRLYGTVKDVDGHLLTNFYVGPRQFDFVLVLPEYTALIELKSVSGPVFGGQNGNWSIRDLTGEKREYPGLNPWRQAHEQALVLSDEMSRFQKAHRNVPKPLGANFYREFEAIACIYPVIDPESEIDITSFKAKVLGFEDIASTITSRRKASSWQLSDWERFAEDFLDLQTISLDEAINPRVYTAHASVNSYLQRLRDFFGHDLAPLAETTAESVRGRLLIDRLAESRHQILVGPSGSCKSFHLCHLVVSLAKDGKEVPILVDPKGYAGGEFSRLLQQSISPYTEVNFKELIGDISACGLRPVLVVDAVNESPEVFRPKLIEKLQAFVLRFQARLVISNQTHLELPPEIQSSEIPIGLPEGEEKVQIFSYYAGEPPSEALAYLSQTFTNAFDLKIAGKCHTRGDHPSSRWELYSRYVRDTLEGNYIVAAAFLRAIAREMMESLTMAIGRDRFEALAESFYRQEQVPLAAIEELLRSRLVVPGDDYVWFEHELLLDFFKAQFLTRKANAANDLASDLSRPRNGHLLELVLAQCDNEAAIEAIVAKADDSKPLGLAVRGHCGPLAQAAVRKQCIALIDLGVAELSTIKLSCQTFEGEDGRKRLLGFSIDGTRPLSKYGALLCGVVAENLEDEAVQRDFLKLLELTDTCFLAAVRNAAQESGVSLRGAYSEALRSYGGLMHYGDGTPFVCSGILSAIRYSRMVSHREQSPLPILSSLVRNVRNSETSYFSFFALLIELQRDSSRLEINDLIDLAQRAWHTGIGWLRMEAVRMLNFLHYRASTLGEDQVARIRELLQSFETKNVLVNTEILEALAGYDGFDPPVSADDALTEMRDLIEATDDPTAEQAECACLFETTWPQYRRDAAYGALGKIFEDIFMGAYSEAYRALPDDQRKKLLELAAMTSRPGFHIDWVLWELLAVSDAESIPIFHRFATELDEESACTQEVVGAFLASIRGYARFSDQPPLIREGANTDRLAWAIIGSILFWWMKEAELSGRVGAISAGWQRLSEEMSVCFPDILQKINESQWLHKEHSINLAHLFPEQIRPLLEAAIRDRKTLTSLFRHGGSADERVLQTVVRTLEEVGNDGSVAVLQDLTEDPTFGKSAVQAIQAVRRRHR